MTAPGYYPDPWVPGGLRWWDGAVWTEHVPTPTPTPAAPAAAASALGPADVVPAYVPTARTAGRPPWLVAVAVVGAFTLVLAMLGAWSVSRRTTTTPSVTAAGAGTATGAPQVPAPAVGPATDLAPSVVPAKAGTVTLPTTTPKGRDLVTPADARHVLAVFWPQQDRVLVTHDIAAAGALTTGAARVFEVGGVACHCLQLPAARRLAAAVYLVRHQSTYPVDFAVEAQSIAPGESTKERWTDILVFTKAGPGRPWLLALRSGYGTAEGRTPIFMPGFTDGSGYQIAPIPRVDDALHARALTMPGRTAALWQTTKETGAVPAHDWLDSTGVNDDRLAFIAAHRQGTAQAGGDLGTFRFYVSPGDQAFSYRLYSGAELLCRAVRETVLMTPPAGYVLVQHTGFIPWGYPLPAGRYHSLSTTGAWQTCWYVPLVEGEPNLMFNTSHDGGYTAVTG